MNGELKLSSEATYIFNTFKVSAEEASKLALEYKSLITAKGGVPSQFSTTEFNKLVTKKLQVRYEWKCEQKKKSGQKSKMKK
ncbi:hypothetical protein [Thalassotalea sp. PS06]|uniref:hypothetical protein n=1 Tax=Thalassotalea sp. PS06 TaxID=2594005 RepID=UPI001165302E|nr:hypothetical protein [Thalassotalea sp. PS06]QDP01419.1 hypothetical protein FNC98_08810 [Thalassotalea sp. PS06]